MTDKDLIRRFQNGEMDAFNQLVRRHYPTSYRFFVRLVQDSMDADDLCQETYIRVYRGIKRFRFESEFTTWLYRISANVANNYFRKKKIRNMFSFGASLDAFSEDQAGKDLSVDPRIWDAIRKLPRKQRMVLILRVFQELPFKQVAGVMGITENSAKVNYHHAVNRMRKVLGDES